MPKSIIHGRGAPANRTERSRWFFMIEAEARIDDSIIGVLSFLMTLARNNEERIKIKVRF